MAVFHIVQIDVDDGCLGLLRIGGQVQAVRIHAGLFLDIVGQKVVLCLKVVVKAAVGDPGLLAYIFDGQTLVALPA